MLVLLAAALLGRQHLGVLVHQDLANLEFHFARLTVGEEGVSAVQLPDSEDIVQRGGADSMKYRIS